MDLVCVDAGDTEWRYNGVEKRYYRLKNGEPVTKIDGKYLPDPDILWTQKIAVYAKKGHQVNVDALKPTPAIFSLWKHWKNAGN